jgi:cytochrome c biogenesis protein CcmG/thiol:disulfide interchange protein DsbE
MSTSREPAAGLPPRPETTDAADTPDAPQADPGTQGRRRWRPPRFVVIWVAAGLAVVAAVIAVDATSHRPAAAPPKPAPALTLPSLLDPAQQVVLSAYQGRPVIVNFFASWCGPCQKETPLLARYYAKSGGKVVVIGVDADDSAANARKFLAAKGVGYPVGFESTPALSDAYGVSEIGIPETFFLDARHRIVKRVLGGVTAKSLNAGVALMDQTR